MARPQPLPPAERTVGQLVAETLRLYGDNFFRSLSLGILPAIFLLSVAEASTAVRLALFPTVGGAVATTSFIGAVAIATSKRPRPRALATAFAAGLLVFAPFPFLASFLLLPGVAWLALVGLVVPVVLLERRALGAGFRRAVALGRADYLHALGSLATFAILALTMSFMLFILLGSQAETTRQVAGFLTILVITPLLFLGAALLYFDQEARVEESRGAKRVRRRSRADVHPADDAHRAGRPDAEVES